MTNRLAAATSPYLLQHADNPVDWREWGPEAFVEARERNVPILLSVGYAACHWCHVMAHESFEDEATAAFMNEHFVNVKVDREERPDVDAVYMSATTAMTGQGGWPMTCVLDHDGAPFFAGTYFPDQPRHGQPAFTQVLQALSAAWRDRPDEVARIAASLREHLTRELPTSSAVLDETMLEEAVEKLGREFDQRRKGFGGAPKFPPSMVLAFLHRHAQRTGSVEALRMLDETLEAMARGGLYDQLGGGFARYSVDAGWVVPHFEKMLYDNAQLLEVYARRGGWFTDRVARETAEFLLRDLRTAEGGFASALDADSLDPQGRSREGAFYVWTAEQIREAIGELPAFLAVPDDPGEATFEHGTSTLQVRGDPGEEWTEQRAALFQARARRPAPARDDKVVAAWNGMAISGLVAAAQVQGRDDWLDAAVRCGELLWRVHGGAELRRVSRDGVPGSSSGVLEDYGCVATGFVALAGATGSRVWLDRAGELIDRAVSRFHADGLWYDAAVPDDTAEQLIARPRDLSDNASPSGLSSIVHALLAFAAMTGSGRHRDLAEQALTAVGELARQAPRFAGWSLAAAEAALVGPVEIALVGESSDLLATAARYSGAVLAREGDLPLSEGRSPVDGAPAAYVCRGFVCRRPVTTVEELRAELD